MRPLKIKLMLFCGAPSFKKYKEYSIPTDIMGITGLPLIDVKVNASWCPVRVPKNRTTLGHVAMWCSVFAVAAKHWFEVLLLLVLSTYQEQLQSESVQIGLDTSCCSHLFAHVFRRLIEQAWTNRFHFCDTMCSAARSRYPQHTSTCSTTE
jgi:hypothetical protein